MFTNSYANEIHEYEQVITYTQWLRVILEDKCEMVYLIYQCQHLTETQFNELLKILQKIEELSDGTLGTCKTDPEDSKIKEDAKPIWSRP